MKILNNLIETEYPESLNEGRVLRETSSIQDEYIDCESEQVKDLCYSAATLVGSVSCFLANGVHPNPSLTVAGGMLLVASMLKSFDFLTNDFEQFELEGKMIRTLITNSVTRKSSVVNEHEMDELEK